jgi:hypothetical protein
MPRAAVLQFVEAGVEALERGPGGEARAYTLRIRFAVRYEGLSPEGDADRGEVAVTRTAGDADGGRSMVFTVPVLPGGATLDPGDCVRAAEAAERAVVAQLVELSPPPVPEVATVPLDHLAVGVAVAPVAP